MCDAHTLLLIEATRFEQLVISKTIENKGGADAASNPVPEFVPNEGYYRFRMHLRY